MVLLDDDDCWMMRKTRKVGRIEWSKRDAASSGHHERRHLVSSGDTEHARACAGGGRSLGAGPRDVASSGLGTAATCARKVF